jgi:glutamine cyclotransferase
MEEMKHSSPGWQGILAKCLRSALLAWCLVFLCATLAVSCATPTEASKRDDSTHSVLPGVTSATFPATGTGTRTASTPRAAKDPTPPAPTSPARAPAAGAIPVYTYRIVNAFPHDPGAFTQGLVFEAGFLYEGTGLWNIQEQSTLRKVELETGAILQLYELPNPYFGEGITLYGDHIIQLTWKARTGFVYDKSSFELLQTFTYPTEGWGITHDGTHLIMSDGTSTLHFWDPETFTEVDQLQVYDDHGPVTRLNELEYIQGEIYANVWLTDLIAIINPHSGQLTGWIDLTGLLGPEDRSQGVDVLNGIAYDPVDDRLFVTGKLWPKLFEIELIPLRRVFLPLVRR